MKKNGVLKLKKIFTSGFNDIIVEDKLEFMQETNLINSKRIKSISFFIIILDLILLYVDIIKFKDNWLNNQGYKNLLYFHIVLLIICGIHFLCISQGIKTKLFKKVNQKIFNLTYIYALALWCTFLTINAQLTHKQISAYIILVFCIASTMILSLSESLIIYLSTYVILIVGIYMISDNFYDLTGNIINATFAIVLVLLVSKINFSLHLENFINKKIILKHTQELEMQYLKAAKDVKNTEKELTISNELLIKEITMRHEAEIQVIRAELLYEEKNRILNETMEYEKLRTDFFANISHELRTPLNVIFSAEQMIDLLCRKGPINKYTISKYIKTIKQNCYRLIRLIGNLIDITKMDAGYFQVDLQNEDIVKVVEDITLSVAEYIENKNINLIFDTEFEEKIIACDLEKIERIMLNLLSNAVKFTPEKGDIFVNIYECDCNIFISVKDTGIGIPEHLQDAIFERFIQADKSTSRNREGSGIGLSLVKSLANLHCGSISLNSKYGSGSEFILKLPSRTIDIEGKYDTNNNCINNEFVEKINIEFSDIYF
ncbi:HAMP domain-containing histidine kinase [Clostridium estertheticum]|uniref:sensor histidine kinase n=1 Tax=Clostridium estertheticum TaxID=238834 RepID=UPI0013E94484|nr:HAMP domain-containing sensor histidine kinase [Clostridium estertheticum]MBZ9689528.1 HAMP domain-containing histidine kinase [Clostridium estertheticum]